MLILGLDTSTSTAGVALVTEDHVVAEARHDTRVRSADLLVRIDSLCRAAKVGPTDLDAIAIGAGPGSFTGLRIGMATAKGIAFAANRPLWAVSSLAALAEDARQELLLQRAPSGGEASPVVCAALDARRGEIFAGWFRDGVALAPERVMAPEELERWFVEMLRALGEPAPPVRFAGDAIEAHRDALGPLWDHDRWLPTRTPSGVAVARLALSGDRVDITRGGAPVYIRPSEAEVKYPDGVPGALRRP